MVPKQSGDSQTYHILYKPPKRNEETELGKVCLSSTTKRPLNKIFMKKTWDLTKR